MAVPEQFKDTIISDTNARYLDIPIAPLMDTAGKGIAKELVRTFGKDTSYSFVCGLGNNGGDGIAAARYLLEKKVSKISVYLIGRASKITQEATQTHLQKLREHKSFSLVNFVNDATAKDIVKSDIVVECLVGTGINKKLKKRFSDVIQKVVKQHSKIVAIDYPVPGYKQVQTISMMYPKVKNAVVVDIGMPRETTLFPGPGDVKILIEPLSDSHKSQNGELLVFGGSQEFHGAPKMAVKAASKFVGSVFYYTNLENREVIKNLKEGVDEFVLVDNTSLDKYADYADAFLFGPGLHDNFVTRSIIEKLLRTFPNKPTVLDAAAIKIAKDADLLEDKILTPHRGESRFLFGDELKKSSLKSLEGKLRRFAKEKKCYILLKGSTDILFSKTGDIAFNKTGNQGMAKGGTGDVLAGLIGALLTKNSPWESMRAAIFVNGKAGDDLYSKVGYNYSAGDLIRELPVAYEWAKEF